jgi:hypothetical protein
MTTQNPGDFFDRISELQISTVGLGFGCAQPVKQLGLERSRNAVVVYPPPTLDKSRALASKAALRASSPLRPAASASLRAWSTRL